MEKILVSALVAALAIVVTEATVCMDDTACSSTQCCYIRPEFLVVSKRQLLLPQQPLLGGKAKEGVCENYKTAGDHCDVFAKMNGHCECGSSMHCAWVPDATTTVAPGGRRSMVYHPEPGAYKCVATK